MNLEFAIVAALLAVVLVTLGRRYGSRPARVGVVALFVGTLAIAALWQGKIRARESQRAALAAKVPRTGRPGGYVSSDACRSCHPEQHASWHQSYHRTMTQLPTPQSVRGNFENVTLEFAGDTYHLERKDGEYWVDMIDPDWRYARTVQQADFAAGRSKAPPAAVTVPPRSRKRISLLTGSHHMQAYWVAGDYGNMQFSVPFTYLFEDQRWAPRNDVFLIDPHRAYTHQIWNVGCVNCHATAGQPGQDPRTKIIQSRAAELGISCEACHGPAEEHVRLNTDPKRRYAAHFRGEGDRSIFNPGRETHVKASEACGQCHAIRHNNRSEEWFQEGLQVRPGMDLESRAQLVRYDASDLDRPGNERKRGLMEGSFWNDGQVRVSGREFNGMSASACYTRGEISCLSCHSLHRYQSTDDQLAVRMEGNQACAQCHGGIASKLAQHTHHRADSTGSLCYNCHMPHTSYGLLKAIRSHQINSPSVASSVATGRPNACNLCHLDRTLEWTSRQLNEWYGQPLWPRLEQPQSVSAALTWLLKGDAGQRALIAWHMGWPPAKDVSGQDWLPPYLAELLVDPYSTVRYVAQRSLKRLPGYEDLGYDYIGPEAGRAATRQRVLDKWNAGTKPPTMARESVLIGPEGTRLEDQVRLLQQQRNDRRMELLE